MVDHLSEVMTKNGIKSTHGVWFDGRGLFRFSGLIQQRWLVAAGKSNVESALDALYQNDTDLAKRILHNELKSI